MKRRNRYSPSEFVKTIHSLILTKCFFSQARIVRRPVYIRGRKSIAGAVGLTTGRFCRFDLDGEKKTLFIGDNCEFGDNTHIVALNKVEIGDDVLIASKAFISDCSHGSYCTNNAVLSDKPSTKPNDRKLDYGSVRIGNNVWIGENAVILKGSDIGDGCVIGANAVITKSIPPGSIVIGANKIIKRYNEKANAWDVV